MVVVHGVLEVLLRVDELLPDLLVLGQERVIFA